MFINIQKYLRCGELHTIECRKDLLISKYSDKHKLCKKLTSEVNIFSIDIEYSTLIEGIPDYFTLYHRNIHQYSDIKIHEQWVMMGDIYKNSCRQNILEAYKEAIMNKYQLTEEDTRLCAVLKINSDVYKIYPYEDGEKIYNEIIEALSDDEVIYTIKNDTIKEEK